MRVGLNVTMTGEMLAARSHAGQHEPLNQRPCQHGNNLRLAVKSAVANYRAVPIIEIKHRRKTQVDAARPQFRTQYITGFGRQAHGRQRVIFPDFTKALHARQRRKSIRLETLNPPPFVVNRNKQALAARGMNFGTQLHQLLTTLKIACKQDHATDMGVAQTRQLVRFKTQPLYIDHDLAGRQYRYHK